MAGRLSFVLLLCRHLARVPMVLVRTPETRTTASKHLAEESGVKAARQG